MAESKTIELEKLAFVMRVLKNMELPKADYKAIAGEEGIKNAENARKKYRRIIQEAGFDLDGDQVVSSEDAGAGAETAVAATSSPKKRKSPVKKPAGGAATSKVADAESPSKKAKHSQPVATDEESKAEVVEEQA